MANIGILLFDGAEEMDFVGPWQVFAAAINGMVGERVVTVAERAGPIRCELGMRVLADCSYDDAPDLDVVLVPGGSGARREIANPATTDWLRDGNLVTAAGVMSGIEMSFWLVGELYGPDVLARTKSYIAYDHPPHDRSGTGPG